MKVPTLSLLFAILCFSGKSQSYNYFFGNIHSHTGYSDGNKDSATSHMSRPIQDFMYAKQSDHIDFYGISEHNHLQAGMQHPGDYHQGLLDADAVNQDSVFVAMYGMEYGVISNGGHVIVYGYDSLIGWDANDYDVFNAEYNYATLWQKVNAKPGCFAYLAHPQTTDYDSLFFKPYQGAADSAIVGMAARSGPAFSTDTNYADLSTSSYIARYKDLLCRGYRVGVGLDHDTHYTVFGRQTTGRLVVLATKLTRANVIDAMHKMRFYSSDDWNLQVDFTINNKVMGSEVVNAYTPSIAVHVTDPDGEATSSIKVYYGKAGSGLAPTLLTSVTNANTLLYTGTQANHTTYYYYLDIIQADTDRVWTSPIWYTRNDSLAAGINTIEKNIPRFVVYPNPNNGIFTLAVDQAVGTSFTIELSNTLGQVVYKEVVLNTYSLELDMKANVKGLYTAKLITANGIATQKVLIE